MRKRLFALTRKSPPTGGLNQHEHTPSKHQTQFDGTPNVFSTKPTILTTPSPRTNPLPTNIIPIASPSPAPLLRNRAWNTNSIIPPMSLAMEKLGVFKNPMANAIPDGTHLAYGDPRAMSRSLNAASSAAIRALAIMNTLDFSGRAPSRSRRARLIVQGWNGN